MAFQHGAGDHAGKWEIEARIVRESDLGVQVDDGVMRAWLPKRKIAITPLKDDLVQVLMPEWLAREKKFI